MSAAVIPTTTYLSRVRLRRDVPAAALRAVLAPDGVGERAATTHRLIWTLFSDSADRARDFLWREAEAGTFYCLSSRAPNDRHGLFDVDAPKPFAPDLHAGDELGFSLRVNATVARGGRPRTADSPGARGKPCDIVMDVLHRTPDGARAEVRQRILVPTAHDWLSRQGEKHGFVLPPLPAPRTEDDPDDVDAGTFRVRGYRVLSIERGRRKAPLRAGVLDLDGVLEVRDPAALVAALGHGFGRAKAFGCGLMLVRRVSAWA